MAQDFRTLLERTKKYDWQFERLQIKDLFLSIQASEMHYSCPRQTFSNPFKYEEWEVAVIDENNRKDDGWLTPDNSEWLREIAPQESWKRDDPGACISTEIVQKIYERMLEL